MAPYKIIKQGYMEKEPPISKRGLRKKLYRYWFVLVEDKKQVALVYFKSEDQYIARQRNEGFIRIDEAQTISVVGEYMGRKHAFVIKTPKGEYTLAPESRYDLHEWLFTLHNSLEVFKKRQEKLRQRQAGGARPRANTTGSTVSSQPGLGMGAQRTPPHTPTRRAPPPPTVKRRPSRPAPGPPVDNHSPLEEMAAGCNEESPPPGYTESDILSMSQDMGHEVTDLDILHVDNDIHEPLVETVNEEGQYPLNEPDSTVESSSNLMHQTSSSMPDLLHDQGTLITTPDDEPTNEQRQEEEPHPQEIGISSTTHIRHTRHHSLTISEIKAKKRRSSRRQGSLKVRSRSPPELPPPPPPAEEEIPQPSEEPPLPLGEVPNGLPSTDSNSSLGMGGVMEALNDIENQIDQMSDNLSPVPVPVRDEFSSVRSPSPVPEMLDSFNEEEWLCDVPTEPLPLTVREEVRQSVLASAENAQTLSVEANHHKSKQVMFKDEVEDIPITYEPVADGSEDSADSADDEVIPSSVAELKKRLFGERESEATRYKREGPLSPKYTHPLNTTFDKFTSRERSPNANNNNSGNRVGEAVDSGIHSNSDEDNLYDKPWGSKALSTFDQNESTLFNHQPTTLNQSTPLKETTPPPVATKPVTESSIASSIASSWGGVAMDTESLLSSISSTLAGTSKYGSDTLLSPDLGARKKTEVRFSSKGELEKIRAEHRREQGNTSIMQGNPLPIAATQYSPQGASPKHSPSHVTLQGGSPKHTVGHLQAMKKKWPNGHHFAGPPRNAASLDALREVKPDTQVTYDANTKSHIFRSLV